MNEDGWREVRRKGSRPKNFHGRHQGPNTTSFYVANLPGDVVKSELWKLCSKLGKLSDIYIAGRRDASGAFFAFVRYENPNNVEDIEKSLNELACRGRKLMANIAKKPRDLQPKVVRTVADRAHALQQVNYRARDLRSFADITKGNSNTAPATATIKLNPIPEVQEWAANAVLVGEAKNFDILCNFPSLFELEGYDVVESKYLGGRDIAIKFRSKKAADAFRANNCIWLKWFSRVEQIEKRIPRFERITWVKIVGVPLPAWDESNFESIASKFGKVLANHSSFWNSRDTSFGKLCILTASRKRINEDVEISLNGTLHRIGIFEVDDEWTPFKPFVACSSVDSEDGEGEAEDEEGVSDTWCPAEMELEEGEIDDSGDKKGTDHEDSTVRKEHSPMHVGSKACSPKLIPNNDTNCMGPQPTNPNSITRFEKETCSWVPESTNTCVPKLIPNDDINCMGPQPTNPNSITDSIAHSAASMTLGRVNGSSSRGPVGSPQSGKGNHSSPEFGPGDSAVKRRRFKRKTKSSPSTGRKVNHIDSFRQQIYRQTHPPSSQSIDLNKDLNCSQNPDGVGTSSQTASTSSSRELDQTKEIGKQVGFNFDSGNDAFINAVNGGGDKHVVP